MREGLTGLIFSLHFTPSSYPVRAQAKILCLFSYHDRNQALLVLIQSKSPNLATLLQPMTAECSPATFSANQTLPLALAHSYWFANYPSASAQRVSAFSSIETPTKNRRRFSIGPERSPTLIDDGLAVFGQNSTLTESIPPTFQHAVRLAFRRLVTINLLITQWYNRDSVFCQNKCAQACFLSACPFSPVYTDFRIFSKDRTKPSFQFFLRKRRWTWIVEYLADFQRELEWKDWLVDRHRPKHSCRETEIL